MKRDGVIIATLVAFIVLAFLFFPLGYHNDNELGRFTVSFRATMVKCAFLSFPLPSLSSLLLFYPVYIIVIADLLIRLMSIVAFMRFRQRKEEILKGSPRKVARGLLLWLVLPILITTLSSEFYVLWFRGAHLFADHIGWSLPQVVSWLLPYPLAVLCIIFGMSSLFNLEGISSLRYQHFLGSNYDGGYVTTTYTILEGSETVALSAADLDTRLLGCFVLQAVCLLDSGISLWLIPMLWRQ